MLNLFKSKKKSPAEMLAILAAHGIRLSGAHSIEGIEAEWGDSLDSFEALLAAMGDEVFDENTLEPTGFRSDDVWHFDAEAIEDHGAYVRIAANLARLAAPALDGLRFADFVDIDEGKAWLEIASDAGTDRHDMRVDDDWADPAAFALLGDGLARAGSGKAFATHDLGQDCLVICKTPDDIRALNKATGLKFRV